MPAHPWTRDDTMQAEMPGHAPMRVDAMLVGRILEARTAVLGTEGMTEMETAGVPSALPQAQHLWRS